MGAIRFIDAARGLTTPIAVALAMGFVGEVPAAEGPKLPPAEYKPLPEGTSIEYDDRTYTVTGSEGYTTVVKKRIGDKAATYISFYALVGEFGADLYVIYASGKEPVEYNLAEEAKKKLEALWPLAVGKETTYELKERSYYYSEPQLWTIMLKVAGTETVDLGGRLYETYVIEERADSDGGMGFRGRKWYHPPTGLIVRSRRIGTGISRLVTGAFSFSKTANLVKDEVESFSLRAVDFPPGASPELVAAARGTAVVGGADKTMRAEVERLKREAEARKVREAEKDKARESEIARLKQEAEEARKAGEARKVREEEEDKTRAVEIARLRQEAQEARRAVDARKAREAEEDKAREAEITRLRKEVEDRRKSDTQLTERDSQQLRAHETEIARLRKEAEERQRVEAARQARERDEALAREAEIARRFTEAEEARKASAAEMAKLKQEANQALKAREVEIARLKQTLAERRDDKAGDSTAAFSGVDFGRYHALVIGIDNYKELPRLKTAISDARAVAEVLEQDYGFSVTLLIDPDAREIVDKLDVYRETLGPKDNLLIYYAGHGWLDQEADRGYWLPVDAKPKRRSGWVSNATVSDTLKTLTAKHVMVVADSCYSGTLVRGADVGTRTRTGDYWKRMAEKWARVAITSGGLEPVADAGGGGHSPFAKAFIDALGDNTSVVDGTTLFSQMRRPVMVAAQQTPQYADVREAGHDGGDFLFVRKKN